MSSSSQSCFSLVFQACNIIFVLGPEEPFYFDFLFTINPMHQLCQRAQLHQGKCRKQFCHQRHWCCYILLFRLEYKTSVICHNVNTQNVKIARADGNCTPKKLNDDIACLLYSCKRTKIRIAGAQRPYIRAQSQRLTGHICDWIFGCAPKNSSVIAPLRRKTQSTVLLTYFQLYLRTRTRKMVYV